MNPTERFLHAGNLAKAAMRAWAACRTTERFMEAIQAAIDYREARDAFMTEYATQGPSPRTPT